MSIKIVFPCIFFIQLHSFYILLHDSYSWGPVIEILFIQQTVPSPVLLMLYSIAPGDSMIFLIMIWVPLIYYFSNSELQPICDLIMSYNQDKYQFMQLLCHIYAFTYNYIHIHRHIQDQDICTLCVYMYIFVFWVSM